VFGTNADNAIDFAGNTISVDNQEVISIANKTSITIFAQAGDDTININGPVGLSGSITVDGGDPTSSDKLIVNGQFGGSTANFAPTGSATGSISVSGLPLTSYSAIESVVY